MQTLILRTDELILERVKSFLSLLPKDKLEVIDPFEIGSVDEKEEEEILALLQNRDTQEIVSKRSYKI